MPIRARWPPENWCGKSAHQRRVETDAIHLLRDVLRCVFAGDKAVRDRRLADDVDDAHPRVERCVRILEDHLHLELLPARGVGREPCERLPRKSARRW
jgi:hypothetical protein